MAYSIYEIENYQDIAKPSDLSSENYYLQDVFFQTRPEVFDYQDNSLENNDEYRNPFFRERDRDEKEDKGDQEKNEFFEDKAPSNWPNRDEYLVKKSSDQIQNIIALYRLENESFNLSFDVPYSNNKVATSIADLMRYTSRYSRENYPNTNLKLLSSDPEKARYVYYVKGYKNWSDPKGHQVILQLEKNPKVKDIRSLDVKVSCSCPFWKYQGPDYNAKRKDYLEGKPYSNQKYPKIKDPELKNLICKHVYAVGSVIQKIIIKNNLDTYKEVDTTLKNIIKSKESDGIEVAVQEISEISDRLKSSEQKEISSLISNFNKKVEKSEDPSTDKQLNSIFDDMVEGLKDILDIQEKDFLNKLVSGFKSILRDSKNFIFKKNKDKEEDEKFIKKTHLINRKGSVNNVIDIYLSEREEFYG